MDDSTGGFVSLVGAGPGDEGLITLRGVERLEQAEVVIYDYLVNEELLRYCDRDRGAGGSARNGDCERIYVGKSAGRHSYSQEEINRLLIEKARTGKRVVRLKGGDPFIFGRGGEEALCLAEANIPFELVPGVSAGSAAAAYAGIPVTHRGLAKGVTFVTGHGAGEAAGKKEAEDFLQDESWRNLAESGQTIVVYMGVKNLPSIAEALMAHGKAAETPAALVSWGTRARQRVVVADLGSIAAQAKSSGIEPPAVAVIGQVVGLREKIRWFEERPLFGTQILVTRSSEGADGLAQPLAGMGAEVKRLPVIEITPAQDLSELDEALRSLSEYRWTVFTSPRGVALFFSRLSSLGLDARAFGEGKVACIGPGTTQEIASHGITADLIPEEYTAEGLAEAFRSRESELLGAYVLFPVSAIARDLLPNALVGMGARCRIVSIYSVTAPSYSREQIEAAFDPFPDLVSFTSSSTVENLVALLDEQGLGAYRSRIRGASIGPVTTKSARELGIAVVVEAKEHSIPGLIDEILDFSRSRKGQGKGGEL